jgi:hypothetical protein
MPPASACARRLGISSAGWREQSSATPAGMAQTFVALVRRSPAVFEKVCALFACSSNFLRFPQKEPVGAESRSPETPRLLFRCLAIRPSTA